MKIRFLITQWNTNRYYAGMKDGKPVFHHLGCTPEQDAEIKHFVLYEDADYELFNTIRYAAEKGTRFMIEKHYIN